MLDHFPTVSFILFFIYHAWFYIVYNSIFMIEWGPPSSFLSFHPWGVLLHFKSSFHFSFTAHQVDPETKRKGFYSLAPSNLHAHCRCSSRSGLKWQTWARSRTHSYWHLLYSNPQPFGNAWLILILISISLVRRHNVKLCELNSFFEKDLPSAGLKLWTSCHDGDLEKMTL